MLSSIQNTANYRQNYKPNFGSLSRGITETLILAAKRQGNRYYTLQDVRILAELAKESASDVGKKVTNEGNAVCEYNWREGHFTYLMQVMTRKNGLNLFTATKQLVQKVTPGWEAKLARIEAAVKGSPKSDADLEAEIRAFAVPIVKEDNY